MTEVSNMTSLGSTCLSLFQIRNNEKAEAFSPCNDGAEMQSSQDRVVSERGIHFLK